MEWKSEEGSLGCTPIFPDSSETLNPPPLPELPKRPANTDHFNGAVDVKPPPYSSAAAGGGGAASFRECRRNHAARAGGKVLDGCGEFMPSGDDGTPEALQCAACGCHRNFHRKDPDDGCGYGGGGVFPRRAMVHPLQIPPPPLASHWAPIFQPVKMAAVGCGGGRGSGGGPGGGTDSSSEELDVNNAAATGGAPPPPPFVVSKKRFRTRFTAEQKGKMMEFAEKVGWRIPREDDAEVLRFCGELGVKRQVFKVWMHNNKSSSKKLDLDHHNQGEES